MVIKSISNDWNQHLESEFGQKYFQELAANVNSEYAAETVYPPAGQVFRAFQLCSFQDTRVIIIGQDPYHREGQANGLSFSVNDNIACPPSLQNIFKELATDIPGFKIPKSGNLEKWANQGVLLLNACLSVRAGNPGSHKRLGWEQFTDAVIRLLSAEKEHLVFMLWGNFAISKMPLIDQTKHLVLTAAHPSPLARGAFFGSRHFSKCNDYLVSHGFQPVNWQL